jgi:hypothetical protein
MKMTVFRDVALCSLIEVDHHFRGAYSLYYQVNHPEHFNSINVHKTQEVSEQVCGVHHATVQKVCNEAFISSSGNLLLLPGKYMKENMLQTSMI